MSGDPKPSLTQKNISFRRQRAPRACETCHVRKVRCDAASLGVPCTNCQAFSVECKIPTPKRKRRAASSGEDDYVHTHSPRSSSTHEIAGRSFSTSSEPQVQSSIKTPDRANADYRRAKYATAPIRKAGRVGYMGESSNLSFIIGHEGRPDEHRDMMHYPLPDDIKGTKAEMFFMDKIEIDILNQRGAFLFPPHPLRDEIVEAYFRWVAPIIPVINRSRFMRQYRNPKNPPSLLLLQAVLLAGSKVCAHPQLKDPDGTTTSVSTAFFKRAKALYDANYEDDRVTIVQALVLMGWYWEAPEAVTSNAFYWTRIATTVAQASGMHRSVESSPLSREDKCLWRRIWWTLFTRDRAIAVAIGRPMYINPDDMDVEMVEEDDFIEDEDDTVAVFRPDPIHVQFFLHYVKLSEIMGLVLKQQYGVASKGRKSNSINLTQSDVALADWRKNCPDELQWKPSCHGFWSALLSSNYYTTLCLLHYAHMPPATTQKQSTAAQTTYPSTGIATSAASMITSIVLNLQAHNELSQTPAFIIYSLFSALIMHVYQMRSPDPAVAAASRERIDICMKSLRDVGSTWLVANVVHALFQSIIGNKTMEDRISRASGRRHIPGLQPQVQASSSSNPYSTTTESTEKRENNGKAPIYPGSAAAASVPATGTQSPPIAQPLSRIDPPANPDYGPKHKLGNFTMAIPSTTPTPPVSYERSRPQTPINNAQGLSAGNMADAIAGQQQQQHTATSRPGYDGMVNNNTEAKVQAAQDAFVGNAGIGRNLAQPSSSVDPPPPLPSTSAAAAPELFLMTRNSPNLGQSTWENFQPNQLFPDGMSIGPSYGVEAGYPRNISSNAGVGGESGNITMQQNTDTSMPVHQQSSRMAFNMAPYLPRPSNLPWTAPVPLMPTGDDQSDNTSQVVPLSFNYGDWLQFLGLNPLGNAPI